MKWNNLTINPTTLGTDKKLPLDRRDDKNPLLTHFTTATKWVIYHGCVMQYHMYTHTCREAGIITVMVTVMQEIKEQSAYYSTAAGRQVVTARRERLLEHTWTHSLALTHTQTLGRWDISPTCETFSYVISLSTRYTWMDCYGTVKDRTGCTSSNL